MKDFTWTKTVVLAAAIMLAGYFIGNTQRNAIQTNRSVEVKGLSEREVMADLAVWPIEITLAGNDLKALKETIEFQKDEVQKFFGDHGFSSDEITIGATNIEDSRAQMYSGNNINREYRYIVKSEITIRTNNISMLQTASAESVSLIAQGIIFGSKNSWRPIEYIFTGLNAVKPSMIEEATINAREVAEKFALDSNSKVGKIKTARQGLFTINDRDQNSPHIKVIRVVSTIDYFVED